MDLKQLKLIKVLSESNTPIKAEQLANTLDISVRSVKKYINDINQLNPSAIASSRNGYAVNRTIVEKLSKENKTQIPQTSKDRIIYIINCIIRDTKPVDSYDLCDAMYISLSTLKLELNKVKRKLAQFDLELVNNSGFLNIEGLETNKRKLLSAIIYQESDVNFVNLGVIEKAFPGIDIAFIRNTILEIFDKYHYFVNDFALISLILHIAIAIDRIKHNGISTKSFNVLPSIKNRDLELAKNVTKILENHFNILYTDEETYELALLLISRTTTIDYKSINNSNLINYVGKENLKLVKELINYINTYYYIQLNEQDFFIRFALHIRSLLVRSRNNYFSKNPLKDGIKTSCPLIYDISVSLASIIKLRTGISIIDDEIAYIAFHLGSAIGSHMMLSTKITAIIYCPTYYDINLRLTDTINRHFSSNLLITNILTDESEFEKISSVDFIISTLPISEIVNIPVVQIGLFLNEIDINSIREKIIEIKTQKEQQFFEENLRKVIVPELFEINNNVKNEIDTIHHMVKKLEAQDYVGQNFDAEILEREKMSSTAFNLFAIPHSMKMHAKKTGLSILINENDIIWSDKPVKLVIMLCFNANERRIFNEIFDPITIILNDINNINKLIRCREYNEFIKTMVSMYNWKCHPENVQF